MISPFVLEAQKVLAIMKNQDRKIIVCEVCGKEFKPNFNGSSHYCSPECRKKNKIYNYTCSQCGNKFIRQTYTNTVNKFCTTTCKDKFTQAVAKDKKVKRPKWS